MADYKRMYTMLLIEMSDTIDRFKKKLNDVEDIYIETEKDSTKHENGEEIIEVSIAEILGLNDESPR